MNESTHESADPVGYPATGEAYFAPIGEMHYVADGAQCHLCGRWRRIVGGQHLLHLHEMTTAEYRELFQARRKRDNGGTDNQ